MQLLVNEAKFTGLWAKNCDTILQVLISKFPSGPENFPGFSRNGPMDSSQSNLDSGFHTSDSGF